jgi:hypothetical protein
MNGLSAGDCKRRVAQILQRLPLDVAHAAADSGLDSAVPGSAVLIEHGPEVLQDGIDEAVRSNGFGPVVEERRAELVENARLAWAPLAALRHGDDTAVRLKRHTQ